MTQELLDASEVREQLVERWGEGVLADGRLERARVGEIVFRRPDELAWLESVLHPLVGERIVQWRQSLPAEAALAVVEVPLLFETRMGASSTPRCAWSPMTPLGQREHVTAERAARGPQRPPDSQDEKAARATHVLRNDGSLTELEDQVARLVPALAALAPGAT